MNDLTFTLKHGTSEDEAREHLRAAVGEVQGRFRGMIRSADWSADGNAVKIAGQGFDVDMRVDAERLHVAGHLGILGGLLSGPFVAGVKAIVQNAFRKRLR
jgi:carbon monoxide dehydrogenase subunit G